MFGMIATSLLVTASSMALAFALSQANAATDTGVWTIGNLQVDDIVTAMGITGMIFLPGPLKLISSIVSFGGLTSGMVRRGGLPEVAKLFGQVRQSLQLEDQTTVSGRYARV